MFGPCGPNIEFSLDLNVFMSVCYSIDLKPCHNDPQDYCYDFSNYSSESIQDFLDHLFLINVWPMMYSRVLIMCYFSLSFYPIETLAL